MHQALHPQAPRGWADTASAITATMPTRPRTTSRASVEVSRRARNRSTTATAASQQDSPITMRPFRLSAARDGDTRACFERLAQLRHLGRRLERPPTVKRRRVLLSHVVNGPLAPRPASCKRANSADRRGHHARSDRHWPMQVAARNPCGTDRRTRCAVADAPERRESRALPGRSTKPDRPEASGSDRCPTPHAAPLRCHNGYRQRRSGAAGSPAQRGLRSQSSDRRLETRHPLSARADQPAGPASPCRTEQRTAPFGLLRGMKRDGSRRYPRVA
jgi:hypothetical protein